MIILKQFDGGAVSPRDDAILYNAIIKNSGVFSGMEITHLGANQILIKEGRGIIKGRVWEHTEETVYCNLSTAGQMKGRLFLHMDLSNLEEPLAIKSIVSETLPELRQDENCNYINGIYEIELCTYDVNDIRISNLQITFPILEDAFPIAKTREETLAVTRDDVLASARVVGGLYSDIDGLDGTYELLASTQSTGLVTLDVKPLSSYRWLLLCHYNSSTGHTDCSCMIPSCMFGTGKAFRDITTRYTGTGTSYIYAYGAECIYKSDTSIQLRIFRAEGGYAATLWGIK